MRIGILGGGQLGRMLVLAGYPLGFEFRLFDPSPDACGGQVAELQVGTMDDSAALERFRTGLDVVTFEWENVPVGAVSFLAERVPVYPPRQALEASQDRLAEKSLFARLGIETAPFAAVNAASDLAPAVARIGLPAVLKTRRMGYDGKGQWFLRNEADIDGVAAAVSVPCILEGFVPFDRELSILTVRAKTGETRFYPLVENHHRDGILRVSYAPAPNLTGELQVLAEDIASRVLTAVGYVGLLAIELFQVGDRLLANEMAPRVHNSGHWSIEGAVTSQFENHVRAVTGVPLGSTGVVSSSAMVNLIGAHPPLDSLLATPGAHVHLYGKEPRAGRKVGHVTFLDQDPASLRERVQVLQEQIERGDPAYTAGGESPARRSF